VTGGPVAAGAVGSELVLDVERVAPGGHCVARHEGRVVFVRHALPGERVRAAVTDERTGYLRADAVEVLRASPDRVTPPCPYAGPGRCGGCDWQHATPAAQRALKGTAVAELLTRVGGLPPAAVAALGVTVRELPGGPLDWRTRVRYAVDGAGRAGLHAHRSHAVVPIDRCLIATPAVRALPVTDRAWPPGAEILTAASATGDTAILLQHDDDAPHPVDPDPTGTRPATPPGATTPAAAGRVPEVVEVVGERTFRVPADGFWQVHPAAPAAFGAAVLELLAPRPGERALDLYGGAGLFSAPLAGAVGGTGRVTMVESGRDAAAAARRNLADLPQVRTVTGHVERVLPRLLAAEPVDIAVLDPPRSGAGRDVVAHLTGTATPTRPGSRDHRGTDSRDHRDTDSRDHRGTGSRGLRGAAGATGSAAARRAPGAIGSVAVGRGSLGGGGRDGAGVRRAVCYVACDPAAFARDVRAFREAGWRLAELRVFDAFPMTQHVECVGLFLPG
jgi:tRNA/tmRNA/rRNA uracil-C5-methylase (TrmA/RlmC/RlmD family)